MQVAQAYVLRLIYYYSIGIRNVKSALYDGGTEKHVIVSGHEVQDLVLQNLSFHLTMSHTYLHVRHEPMEDIMDGLEFLHPVMNKEYLPSPVKLIPYYLLKFIVIKKHYLRLYRNPVWRRSTDYRKVTCSQKRKLKSSRDRSCGQCQGIHRCLELTKLFLGTNSELLFLIDYKKP